ncbi:thioesterase family protein [Dongia soli]|uniref:Thioesterase family protein n=1 Tax=Dongia soli TaxID=600628 RepID=A0ABU5EHG6_9PROT|nr:thioesterase family protein [Dongia soli]MDY0884853.1 thioesterase family protein [Dongia soli]
MAAPLALYETVIKPDWIDLYDHMNVAYYVLICDEATGAFWNHVNGGRSLEHRQGGEMVVLENHVNYVREVRLGDPVRVTTQLLEYDTKRVRLFHTLLHATEGFVSATNEVKAIGFDLNQRRITSFQPLVQTKLQEVWEEQRHLPVPPAAGKGITLGRS